MCSTIDDLERFYAALIPPIIKPQLVPDQEALVERLLKSNHYTLYPPALTFQRRFWKAIITHIEEQHEEVLSEIYDRFLDLGQSTNTGLVSGPPPPSYITYSYQKHNIGGRITLLESRTTIEAGTTGLRTWRAAFCFGDWLIDHPDLIQGQSVLELGSGTGFLGVLCAQLQSRSSKPSRILLTDYNDAVLERCRLNLEIKSNGLGTTDIGVLPVDWFHALDPSCEREFHGLIDKGQPGVIIGTDLVYDPSIIPALSATILLLLGRAKRNGRHIHAYIALALRRAATFEAFIQSCRSEGLKVRDTLLNDNDHGAFSLYTDALPSINAAGEVRLLDITMIDPE